MSGGVATPREEHLAWVRERALAELKADPSGEGPLKACASLISDLRKHPATCDHGAIELTTLLQVVGRLTTADEVRAHIGVVLR